MYVIHVCKINEWFLLDNAESAEDLFQALDESGVIDKLFTVAYNILGALTSSLVGAMREHVSKFKYGLCLPLASNMPGNDFINRIEIQDIQNLIEAIEKLGLFADINREAIGMFWILLTLFGYCIQYNISLPSTITIISQYM